MCTARALRHCRSPAPHRPIPFILSKGCSCGVQHQWTGLARRCWARWRPLRSPWRSLLRSCTVYRLQTAAHRPRSLLARRLPMMGESGRLLDLLCFRSLCIHPFRTKMRRTTAPFAALQARRGASPGEQRGGCSQQREPRRPRAARRSSAPKKPGVRCASSAGRHALVASAGGRPARRRQAFSQLLPHILHALQCSGWRQRWRLS